MGVWANLVGYGGVFLEPATTGASFEAIRYAYHGGRVFSAVLFLVMPNVLERFGAALRLCVPLLMCFCTMGYALAYYQTLLPPPVLGGVASFLLGCGYIWVVASFYIMMAHAFSLRLAMGAAIACQVAEHLLSVVANLCLSPTAQIVVCCLCPLVSLAGLVLAWGREGQGSCGAVRGLRSAERGNDGGTPLLADKARSHAYALLVVSGVAIVALGAVSSVGQWGSVRAEYAAGDAGSVLWETILACAFLAVFAAASLLPAVGRPLSYRYQVPFLIIVGSVMLAVLLPYAPHALGVAVSVELTAAEYFSHVLMWVVLMASVQEVGRPAYFLSGAALAPYGAFSLGWIVLLETNQAASMFVALAISYVLIIAVAVHPRLLYERRQRNMVSSEDLNEYTIEGEPEIPVESNGVAVVDVVRRRCALLGRQYRLSQRETQVLALLAQGRSRPAIQRELVLSEGTIKTHIAHIYEKMGVGSHQEVLDIVYDAPEREKPSPAET